MSDILRDDFNILVEDPYLFYARLRNEYPIMFYPELDAWLVTSYKDVRNILLQHDKISSSNALASSAGSLSRRVLAEIAKGHIPDIMVVNIDKPDHTRLKAALAKGFTPARIKSLEPFTREIANRLVDAFIDQQQAEIISQFAYPLVFEVVLTLLGVPKQDLSLTRKWVDDWIALTFVRLDEEHQLACVESMLAMQQYLAGLIAERRDAPQDDLISTLALFCAPDMEPLTEREMMGMLQGLILAGMTSTTAMISTGLRHLLACPERWQVLCEYPEHIPQAVEEILRFDGPTRLVARVTTQEITVGGVTLPENTSLLLVLGSGNRDEAVFANADEFQLQRTPNHHLAFGHGIHYCTGAALARLEGQVAFEVLGQRLPQLRLVPGQTLIHMPNLMLRGYERLEVEW